MQRQVRAAYFISPWSRRLNAINISGVKWWLAILEVLSDKQKEYELQIRRLTDWVQRWLLLASTPRRAKRPIRVWAKLSKLLRVTCDPSIKWSQANRIVKIIFEVKRWNCSDLRATLWNFFSGRNFEKSKKALKRFMNGFTSIFWSFLLAFDELIKRLLMA